MCVVAGKGTLFQAEGLCRRLSLSIILLHSRDFSHKDSQNNNLSGFHSFAPNVLPFGFQSWISLSLAMSMSSMQFLFSLIILQSLSHSEEISFTGPSCSPVPDAGHEHFGSIFLDFKSLLSDANERFFRSECEQSFRADAIISRLP